MIRKLQIRLLWWRARRLIRPFIIYDANCGAAMLEYLRPDLKADYDKGTELAHRAMTMDAEDKGYAVIAASPFEVGLTKNGQGIRTWFANDFGGELPELSHPLVQKAIKINEEFCAK